MSQSEITPIQRAVVDEFGELQRKVDEFSPSATRYRKLREAIDSWYADADPALDFTAEGDRYTAQIGPRRRERQIIAMPKLFRLLGQARFLKFCGFPLRDLDANVTAEEQTSLRLAETRRTGPRIIKAVAHANPEEAAA